MGDDIESFIAQQKAKLANERQALNDEPHGHNAATDDGRERQKWTRYDPGNAPPPAVEKQQYRETRAVTPIDRGLPLTNRGQEERQKALAKERRKEYNDLLEKKASQNRSPTRNAAPVRQGLDIGHYEDERKLLDRERQQDLKDYLDQQRKQAPSVVSYPENQPVRNPDQGKFDYQEQKKQLAEERRREYNQMLQTQAPQRAPQRDDQTVLNDNRENRSPDHGRFDYQEQRKQLAEERRKEYNQMLQTKGQRTRNPQREEQEIDNPSIIPFNRAEQERIKAKLLEEERQREYNETKVKMAERSRKREVTPIQNFDPQAQEQERRYQKEKEQREYKAMLDKQQDYQKQMLLLQQGVPYEKVSKIVDEPKPTQPRPVDYTSQPPYGQDVDLPYGEPARDRPNKVQFDLDRHVVEPSPILAAHSRLRSYDDQPQPSPYNQRPEKDSRQQYQRQEQDQDQFHGLEFGLYEEHKKKLNKERRKELQEYLAKKNRQGKMNNAEYQQQWRQHHEGNHEEVGLSLQLTPRSKLSKRDKSLENEEYKKQWYQIKGRFMKPGTPRKQWKKPDATDILIRQVQREKDIDQYQREWRKFHPGEPQTSPRQPMQNHNMTGGRMMDTERLVNSVLNQNQNNDGGFTTRRANADSGLNNLKPVNPAKPINKDNYLREWEESKNQLSDPRGVDSTVANESKLNIEKTIRTAKQEADDYRQKWAEYKGQDRNTKNLSLIHLPERKHFDNLSLHRNSSAYEAQKQRLRLEQKKDLNEFLKKSPSLSRLSNQSSPFKTSADYRKRLSDIRNQEYNDFLQKKNEKDATKNRKWHTPETAEQEEVFPLGRYEKTHQHYVEQRKQDLQQHLSKSQPGPVQYYRNGSEGKEKPWQRKEDEHSEPFPLGGYAQIRKKLNEERRREYNELQAQSVGRFTPRSQGGGVGGALLIRDDGRREHRLKKMEHERNMEYREMLTMKRSYPNNASLRDQTDEFKAGTLPGNESDNVKWQQRKQRNQEYNEYLASRNQKQPRPGQQPSDSNTFNSLPRLNYSTSAQRRDKELQRNQEYKDMLLEKAQRQRGGPPSNVRTGWGTPDYNDILAKNRAKEQNFRRANDIAFEADPVTRQTEFISKALDRDLEATKAAYKRERIYNVPGKGLLEDPHWLSPWRSPRYPYHNRHYNQWHPYYNGYYDYWEESKESKENPISHTPKQNGQPSVRRSKDQGGEYFASLPIGRNTESAEKRQKNQYSYELKMQMAQAAHARQYEKQAGLLVNNNSVATQPPVARATPRQIDPFYNHLKDVKDYDELSPRSNAILGRRQPTFERLKDKGGLNVAITPRGGLGGNAGTGLLDAGLFDKPRATTVDPPPELIYQPSTFITANAIPTLNNSVEEAYNFYASKNPLDPDLNAGPVPAQRGGGGGGQRNVPNLDLRGLGGGDPVGPTSKVRFQDQRTAAQGMEFKTDEDRNKGKKQTTTEYRAELERQMAENNVKKQRAKEERERYEMKMEEEAKYYDPFGKGGGGAPMRDAQGNVISNLRQIRSDNQAPVSNRSVPRELPPSFNFDKSPRGGNSYRDDLIGPPPTQTTADGDPSFARGGHGIFGMPKTDVEKMQADKYKLDLKRQIEEKKAEESRKKEMQRLDDEREQKILDEQRARIQREYDDEQRRNLEKKEEARLKNEELMRAAEDKKRELERQRREEEERRQEELRQKRDREQEERQREEEAKRGKSPPIPALRGKDGNEEPVEEPEPQKSSRVVHSPHVGAPRTRTPDVVSQQDYPNNRAQSADVLNQLTRLRAELRKESDRVQTMLHDQDDDVQIYDPRQIHRPPPGPIVSNNRPSIDVFETAVNKNPVVVRRTPNERANSRVVDDFNSLKHKMDTDSRKQFREMYPHEPLTGDALEAQQAALLQQQEERLRNMKDRRALEDTSALRVAGRDTHSSSSQLHSNSAFVDVNGLAHFPDDFEDIPQQRNDSARYRRRNRIPSSPQIERIETPNFNSRATFGSQTSLNVDKMAKKNEDRLRKLRDLQGDDLSLYDPEDVLDRFMSKQGHNRAPSRNTLLDDTWMRAGSKRSEY